MAVPSRRKAYAGFALFGAFWGAWGASLPAVRDQADVNDGQLGAALLFVGAGALPAMLLAGRAVDRWHERATATFVALMGVVGVGVIAVAQNFVGLVVSLTVLGAVSGATDVAINTAAGTAHREHGGAVVARAHASFSAAVVIGSLTAGGIGAVDLPLALPFIVVAAAALGVAVVIVRVRDPQPESPADDPAAATDRGLPLAPLLVIGGLGALAFAVENAHQNWSALYLRDVVDAGPALAAAGPAVFAGTVAVTRFVTGGLSERPRAVLVGGAVVAAAGTAALAATHVFVVAVLGLALAASGTGVLFPTLIVVLTSRVSDAVRGAATSRVTTVAYLGMVAGPAYVGAWSAAVGLQGAMAAVAVLALALAALSAIAVRSPAPSSRTSASGEVHAGVR